MPAPDLSQILGLSFDCYGTLIDWESGLLGVLIPWAQRNGLTTDAETLLGVFSAAESDAETVSPGSPYRSILRDVMRRIAERLGAAATEDDGRRLAESVGEWPAFEDTAAALDRLQRRCALVIVSNIDRVSFAGTQTTLGVAFDAVVTADEVGAYKPDARMFEAAEDAFAALGVARGEHLHVAQSLYHDITPAAARGWRTCWVDRRSGRPGGATPAVSREVKPDLMVRTLAELADLFEGAS